MNTTGKKGDYHDLVYLAGSNGIDEREGRFIAAANPAVILELLTIIERKDEELNQLRQSPHPDGFNL